MILNVDEKEVAHAVNLLDDAEVFEFFRIVIADLEYDKLKQLQSEVARQLKYNYNES